MKHNRTGIAALLLASVLCLTACGGESSAAPQSSASADVSVSETDAPAESSEEESAAETDAPAPAEDNTVIDYGSLSIQIPSSFHITSGEPGSYRGETEHNPKVAFLYCEDAYYKSRHEGEEYTYKDVQDCLKSNIFGKLRDHYSCYEDTCEITVDSEEEVDVLGKPFVLRKGVTSNTETTLHYVGCYGVQDSHKRDLTDIPFAWIAYTEETSEEALAEIEEIVRNATKSAEFTT